MTIGVVNLRFSFPFSRGNFDENSKWSLGNISSLACSDLLSTDNSGYFSKVSPSSYPEIVVA